MRSALQLSKRVQAQGEAKPKQKSSLLYPPFSFLRERKGFYLRSACSYEQSEVERRPFLSQTLSNPTAREKLLRCAQFLYVLSHCKFKICVFRMRVSVGQI